MCPLIPFPIHAHGKGRLTYCLLMWFHFVILAPFSFPCVISTFILIPFCLVRVFWACGSTIPLLHVESMNQAPPSWQYPMFQLWCFIYAPNEFWPFKLFLKILGAHQNSNSQSESPFANVWAHSLTPSSIFRNVNVIPRLHSWPSSFHAFGLVTSPKQKSW